MKSKLSFSDLINFITQETGASKKLVYDLIKELAAIIEEGLIRDGNVSIAGLGSFKLEFVGSNIRKLPQSENYREISEHKKVLFRPEKSLREFINRKYAALRPIIVDEPKKNVIVKDISQNKIEKTNDKVIEKKIKIAAESIPVINKEEQANKENRVPVIIPISNNVEKKTTDLKKFVDKKLGDQSNNTKVYYAVGVVILLLILSFFLFRNKPEIEYSQTPQLIEASTESGDNLTQKPENRDLNILPQTNNIASHKIERGDNLWALATKYYGNPYLWPNIYRANESIMKNPDVLIEGHELSIPSLEGDSKNLSENDNYNIALGYLKAYLKYKELGKTKASLYLWAAKKFDQSIVQKYRETLQKRDLKLWAHTEKEELRIN